MKFSIVKLRGKREVFPNHYGGFCISNRHADHCSRVLKAPLFIYGNAAIFYNICLHIYALQYLLRSVKECSLEI